MKNLWTIPFALCVLSSGAVLAQPAGHPYSYQAAPQGYPGSQGGSEGFEMVGPDVIVRAGVDKLRELLGKGPVEAEEVERFLDQEITPFFDFDYMASWAGGPLYRQMTPEQRAVFAQKLKGLFFAALARNLGTYATPEPQIEVFPPRMRPQSREVTVMARVTPQSGYPIRLEFRFYLSNQGWRVFDVTANGTSAVAFYRRYFAEVAMRGSIEACCR